MKQIVLVTALFLSLTAGAGACKKSSPGASVAVHNAVVGGTASLWELAPKGTAVAIVVAAGAGDKLAAAITETLRVVRAQPLGAMLAAALEAKLPALSGIDPLDPAGWKKAGVDVDKGAAMFVTPNHQVVGILPITDRAAFRAFTHARKQTASGVAYDRVGHGYCREIRGRYACASELATLATIGTGAGGPLPRFAAALPKQLRGDIELIADVSKFPTALPGMRELSPALTDIKHLVLAARVGGGRLSLRGWIEGQRGGLLGRKFVHVPDKGTASRLIAGADGAVALRLPHGVLSPRGTIIPAGPGLDPKADFLDNLTGEFSATARGGGAVAGRIAWGLKDPKRLQDKLSRVCEGLAAEMPRSAVTMSDGRCVGRIPTPDDLPPQAKVLSPLVDGTKVALAVEDDAMVVTVGEPSTPTGQPGNLAGGADTHEILAGDWQALLWARSLDPLAGLKPAAAKQLTEALAAKVPAPLGGEIRLGRWLAAHVYDIGAGASLRADGLHALIAVDTFAADPPAVYKQYEAAVAKSVNGDFAGYRSALAAIAKQQPHTLAGRQAAAVARGVPAIGPGTGLMAAVFIPAFMKYRARREGGAAGR